MYAGFVVVMRFEEEHRSPSQTDKVAQRVIPSDTAAMSDYRTCIAGTGTSINGMAVDTSVVLVSLFGEKEALKVEVNRLIETITSAVSLNEAGRFFH